MLQVGATGIKGKEEEENSKLSSSSEKYNSEEFTFCESKYS
jgi:hypothetical protein